MKWDVLRELGDARFQPNRFDYDYTNIYRSTQDLDIVVNGSAQEAQEFEQALKTQFPYFLGSKAAAWEVRSIKEARGDKGGLLGDFGFMNQHTDSNSTGMVELTQPPAGESVVRDLRDWNNNTDPTFLKDAHEGRLTLYHSPRHNETPRSKSGQNPPIFFAIRALTKAFQYDLKINGEDLAILQREINQFDPRRDLSNSDAARWIEKNGKKLFQHAVDLEYAWNTLEKLGLRKKLISIQDNPDKVDSLAWWMSKEPLRAKPVGEGSGKTAESLGIKTVAHATNDFLSFESITRSHTGAPNVYISRQGAAGEAASFGDGFYTVTGEKGARETGITIRFEVDPKAKEGSDFVIAQRTAGGTISEGDFIVFKNKNAFRVIPESLDMSPVDYFEFLAGSKTISRDDQALLWKLKRRLDHTVTSGRIPPKDMEEIRAIVLSQLKSASPNRDVVVQEWLKIEGARLKKDPKEILALTESLKAKSYHVDPAPFFSGISELSRGTKLEHYVTQEWLPSIFGSLKPDVGDRALEHSLFSIEPQMRQFGAKVLAERESKQLQGRSGAFVRALKEIQALNGDWATWLKSATKGGEEAQTKAAYLALHPEYRSSLTESELRAIEPAIARFSNISVFEKLAGGRLPTDVRSESFKFNSYDFPAGGKRVQLGSPSHEPGRYKTEDQHEVTFTKPFEMQATPVTQLQWSLVMGDNPSKFKTVGNPVKIGGRDIEMHPNRPVEQISWEDAQKFIEKLNQLDTQYNYRLPTEAEWEYAARAGSDTPYSFGSEPDEVGGYGWHSANSGSRTHDVASLKPNPHGLYDMHGNVWEWVQDKWQGTRPAHAVDPTGPELLTSGSVPVRVLRGGGWNYGPLGLRSAQRSYNEQGNRDHYVGFRLVRTPK